MCERCDIGTTTTQGGKAMEPAHKVHRNARRMHRTWEDIQEQTKRADAAMMRKDQKRRKNGQKDGKIHRTSH